MEKWVDYQFESSSGTTEEFVRFAREFKRELKKLLPTGYIIDSFSRGHFYISLFVRNVATNKLAYISTSDVRHFPNEWYNNMLIRTAKHDKD